MKYNDYLNSAKRYNYTCRLLRDKAIAFDSTDRSTENFKYLIDSLYYLSGYVIECSLKFKIFECSGYDSELEIEEEECKKNGINYKKHIKTHSFSKLQDFLSSKTSGISHESDDHDVSTLLKNWDPGIRYEKRDLNFETVNCFYDHVSRFLKKM